MGRIGGLLLFFGIGSVVLMQFNAEFTLLSWMDDLEPAMAWGIRGIAILVGAGLLFAEFQQNNAKQKRNQLQ